jgi:hypothetical protein
MENRDNMRAVAIWDAEVMNGLTDADIKCWPNSESIPDYVPERASLIFDSGYVDRADVVRAGLDVIS